jgi:hypothetical protein
LADFLWYFLCSATKKVHQNRHTERARLAALGEAVEKVVKNSAIPKKQSPRLQPELEDGALLS